VAPRPGPTVPAGLRRRDQAASGWTVWGIGA
jgi:hypothetical protein